MGKRYLAVRFEDVFSGRVEEDLVCAVQMLFLEDVRAEPGPVLWEGTESVSPDFRFHSLRWLRAFWSYAHRAGRLQGDECQQVHSVGRLPPFTENNVLFYEVSKFVVRAYGGRSMSC